MTPILDGRAWSGTGHCYGTLFLVELFESGKHPGDYHFPLFCAADDFAEDSKRPINADFLEGHLDVILKRHNLLVSEMDWEEVVAAEMPLSGSRARSGE